MRRRRRRALTAPAVQPELEAELPVGHGAEQGGRARLAGELAAGRPDPRGDRAREACQFA